MEISAFFMASGVIILTITTLMLKGRRPQGLLLLSGLTGLAMMVAAARELCKVKDYPEIDTLSVEAQDFFWRALRKHQNRVTTYGGLWMVANIVILWSVRHNSRIHEADSLWEKVAHSGLWISALLLFPVLASAFFLLAARLKSRKNMHRTVKTILKYAVFTAIYFGIAMRIQKFIMITGHHFDFWICAVALYVFILFAIWCLGKDGWSLLPYIAMIPAVEHKTHKIYTDAGGNYCIRLQDEDDFKILQLTDIHLGGSRLCAYADQLAVEAVYDLIRAEKPDFIIVTGDLVFALGIKSFSTNNYTPIAQFAAMMRNIGIPWAFTYGNHDTEFMASHSIEEICALFQRFSYGQTFNLLYPEQQPGISGRSNQMIKIINRDGTVRQLIFLLDSNAYIGTHMKTYDCVHEDQIRWYEMMVRNEMLAAGHPVPSLMFFHIPLKAYADAYEKYKKGSSEVIYHYGRIGEKHEEICYSKLPCRLFDAVRNSGSTKGIFAGHDHYNNISMTYQGIRLTYGLSIDYLVMPGIRGKESQRGATRIMIKRDGGFDCQPVYLHDINRKI